MKSLIIEYLVLCACACGQLVMTGPAWKLKLNQACICEGKVVWRLLTPAVDSPLCLGTAGVSAQLALQVLSKSLCRPSGKQSVWVMISSLQFLSSSAVILPLRFYFLGALFTFLLSLFFFSSLVLSLYEQVFVLVLHCWFLSLWSSWRCAPELHKLVH